MITHAQKMFFDGIKLDNYSIYFGKSKNKLAIAKGVGIYNQVADYLNKKHKDKGGAKGLDDYICDMYGVSAISSDLKRKWEDSLIQNTKPNFYASMMVLKRRTHTQVDVYAIVDDGVVELICESGTSMYNKIRNYCEFWERGNRWCDLYQVPNPADVSIASVKEDFRVALANKIIPVVDDIKVLSNDRKGYSLAYYDLGKGSLDKPTPAWDNFLSQMADDGVRNIFRAWVYSIFVGDNYGRQVLWLHGIGATGKSVVANCIYNALSSLNPSIVTSLEAEDHMDRFSGSSYTSKRFVLGADSTDKAILRNPLVKNLTGRDVINVRKMGEMKRSEQAYAKVMITSNVKPFIDTEKTEEVSRLILISLVPEYCKQAYTKWHENDMGDFPLQLQREFDDFIRQSKASYEKCLSQDNHNLTAYEGHDDMLGDLNFYIKRDIRTWWDGCIEKTDNPADILVFNDMTADYERFAAKKVKFNYYSRKLVRSFMLTYLRSTSVPIKELDAFKLLYIQGYKFKGTAEDRITTEKIIDEKIKEIQQEHTK